MKKNLELDVDTSELTRAIHRIVRGMHDGECPKCHRLFESTAMVWSQEYGKGNPHNSHKCPHCGFSITHDEMQEAIALFGPLMEHSLELFELWRAGRAQEASSEPRAGKDTSSSPKTSPASYYTLEKLIGEVGEPRIRKYLIINAHGLRWGSNRSAAFQFRRREDAETFAIIMGEGSVVIRSENGIPFYPQSWIRKQTSDPGPPRYRFCPTCGNPLIRISNVRSDSDPSYSTSRFKCASCNVYLTKDFLDQLIDYKADSKPSSESLPSPIPDVPKGSTSYRLERGNEHSDFAENEPLEFVTIADGMICWTKDSAKALELHRRSDAEMMVSIVEDCDRIRELKPNPRIQYIVVGRPDWSSDVSEKSFLSVLGSNLVYVKNKRDAIQFVRKGDAEKMLNLCTHGTIEEVEG